MEYFYIGLVILVVIVLLLTAAKKKFRRPDPVTTLVTTLVVMGIIFSDAGRFVSYSMYCTAVLIAIVNTIRSRKSAKGDTR